MDSKYFDWNEEKNQKLKDERDISFEEILDAIEDGQLLDIVDNPQREKYSSQKMFIVNVNNYVFVVPFVEDEEKVFLKTIFPSRKETKKYLSERKNK